MRTVRLHGELGRRFGRVHKFDISTPVEAFRALDANYPEFQQFLYDAASKGLHYKVVADKEQIGPELLDAPFSKAVSVTPVVAGQAPVGALLIGTLLPGIAVSTTLSLIVGTIASVMLLKGVSSLLTPHPKTSQNTTSKTENPYFNGPAQTTLQGVAVPFGYGRLRVGSRIASAGITTDDQYNASGANIMGGFIGPTGRVSLV